VCDKRIDDGLVRSPAAAAIENFSLDQRLTNSATLGVARQVAELVNVPSPVLRRLPKTEFSQIPLLSISDII
jgi:hypothetical protein